MITTVQCSICSQLNNKHRVVVTDFSLHHTMQYNCERSELSGEFNGKDYIYIIESVDSHRVGRLYK